MPCRYPVKSALNLLVGSMTAAPGSRIISAVNLFYNSGFFVLLKRFALDDIRSFKSNFSSGGGTKEFIRRIFHEIIPFNINLIAEGNLPCSHAFVFRIVENPYFLNLIFRIIGDDNLKRIKHSENPWRPDIKIFTDSMFQEGDIVDGFHFSISNEIDKSSY